MYPILLESDKVSVLFFLYNNEKILDQSSISNERNVIRS